MAKKARQFVQAAVMAAVLVILAQVIIPVGPVPFTMAIFGAALAGGLLSPAAAAYCVGVYLLLGAVGVPVFSGFRGGLSVLLGPAGGFLAGYVFVAVGVSLAMRVKTRYLPVLLALPGLFICHLLGVLWFGAQTGTPVLQAVLSVSLPFLLPDMAKIAFAVLLEGRLRARMSKTFVPEEADGN